VGSWEKPAEKTQMASNNKTFFEDLTDGKISLEKIPGWAWWVIFLLGCYVIHLMRENAAAQARVDQFLIDHGVPRTLP
jgi:hypothetical protein